MHPVGWLCPASNAVQDQPGVSPFPTNVDPQIADFLPTEAVVTRPERDRRNSREPRAIPPRQGLEQSEACSLTVPWGCYKPSCDGASRCLTQWHEGPCPSLVADPAVQCCWLPEGTARRSGTRNSSAPQIKFGGTKLAPKPLQIPMGSN